MFCNSPELTDATVLGREKVTLVFASIDFAGKNEIPLLWVTDTLDASFTGLCSRGEALRQFLYAMCQGERRNPDPL